MTPSRRVLLLAACAAAACEPVDDRVLTVKPEPIVLSNFEDMSDQPLDPRFTPWEYTVYNTDIRAAQAYIVTPGHDSNWCLRWQWEFTDPPNRRPDYPGTLERTQIPGSIDLRPYTRFVFSHHYEDTGTCVDARKPDRERAVPRARVGVSDQRARVDHLADHDGPAGRFHGGLLYRQGRALGGLLPARGRSDDHRATQPAGRQLLGRCVIDR